MPGFFKYQYVIQIENININSIICNMLESQFSLDLQNILISYHFIVATMIAKLFIFVLFCNNFFLILFKMGRDMH